MLRALGDSWDSCRWEDSVLEAGLPPFTICLQPALHMTVLEINLSANPTRAVCYLLGFAKAHVAVAGPSALHVTSALRCKRPQAGVGAAVGELSAFTDAG